MKPVVSIPTSDNTPVYMYIYYTLCCEAFGLCCLVLRLFTISISSLKLNKKWFEFQSPSPSSSSQFLIEVARKKNSTPLPLIPEKFGPQLPPERYCLTANNFRLKDRQKPVRIISLPIVMLNINFTQMHFIHTFVDTGNYNRC